MAYSVISILYLSFFLFQSVNGAYNVISFGAKPDGQTNSTSAFLSAWAAACSSFRPATILIPRGKFLLGHTPLRGPCNNAKISIQIRGTLVAPSNYAAIQTHQRWLYLDNVQGLSFYGGRLDGRGKPLWACKAAGRSCPTGASSLVIHNAKDISITGLTLINSQLFHLVIHRSENVEVRETQIIAPGDSPNTDGIHVQQSKNVAIVHAVIKTGDDCISVGPGTMNLWVERVACGPGHGISIGSLAKDLDEAGVQNVTVKSVVFSGTQNGLRIKSWGRPSYGFVRGVVFQNAIMRDVHNPIIIDQNYCPHNKNCPGQHSGVKIRGVKYGNIRGTSATKVAVKFECSPSNPCKDIGLHNVQLSYQKRAARASCANAYGTTSGLVVPPSCL